MYGGLGKAGKTEKICYRDMINNNGSRLNMKHTQCVRYCIRIWSYLNFEKKGVRMRVHNSGAGTIRKISVQFWTKAYKFAEFENSGYELSLESWVLQ